MTAFESKSDQAISRRSFGAQVASALRRDIVRGEIKPGTALVQEWVCQRYDVSRIPVRDALMRLEAEGFVSRNHRNQMIAAEFTEADLLETFHLEALLSGVAARRAAVNGTEEEFDRLRAIVASGDDLHHDEHADELADIAWEFHRSINKMCRSSRVLVALRAVSIHFVQDFGPEIKGWWQHSHQDHHSIVTAIASRDADKAERLMVEHFENAGQAFARFLRDHAIVPIR